MSVKSTVGLAVFLGIVVGFGAVWATKSGDPPGRQVTRNADISAARLGGRVISIAELDARWRERSPSEFTQAMQAVYDGRMSALRGLVEDTLIADAAKSRGVTQEEFERSEILSRIQPVGAHDAEVFYASNQDQMQGRSFQEMEAAIGQHIERRAVERARASVIEGLRRTSAPLQVMLDAPRLPVSVEAGDPSLGGAKAAVTIVEFADFQCPFCARVEPTLKQLHERYGDAIRIVWKDFPLTSIHPGAFQASEASYCAEEQGKYWPYRDRLFANQQALDLEHLTQYASDAGLNAESFSACLASSKYATRVQHSMDAGKRIGVESTPTLFINGRMLSGSQPYETFAAIVDEELERAAAAD